MRKTKEFAGLSVPVKNNDVLERVLENVNKNIEIHTLWKVNNVNAIDRLGMSDHGHTHFQIVSNIGLKLLRMIKESGVSLNIEKDFELDYKYAEVVVFLGCIFHDLGISIHRDGHEEFSLFLANKYLEQVLDFLDTETRIVVSSEVLHTIIAHRSGGVPLTIEAGIVRVADALDMTKGRNRIAFEAGFVEIYSISAVAIEDVKISKGTKKPIQIDILMNNSSGVFQIDNLLKEKLKGSKIEEFVTVRAYIDGVSEKKLLKEFVLG